MSKRTRRAVPTGPRPAATPGSPDGDPIDPSPGTGSAASGGSHRSGRRQRSRPLAYEPERSFLDLYRNTILGLGAVAVVLVVVGFLFFAANQPAYACETIWSPNAQEQPPEARYIDKQKDRKRI